jgi:hypothetical protein
MSWKFSIIDQHYALIIPLFITQAPTCLDIYVPSSGSVVYPCELLNVTHETTTSDCTQATNVYSTGVHPDDTTISDFQ